MIKNTLLLIGSPKKSGSVSEKTGMYFLNLMKNKGSEAKKVFINSFNGTSDNIAYAVKCVEYADLIVLACPLYIDSIPSSVISFMELIAGGQNKKNFKFKKGLVVIIQCGFPESFHNDVVIEIYKHFAAEVGLKWLGSLTFGMSAVMNLDKTGILAMNVKKAIKMTTDAVLKGMGVPEEATMLARKPFIPVCLYMLLGNIFWVISALKNKTWQLDAIPYASR